GFTILAVLTLAVGVGGIAALVGIARPLFISPLPYPHPDQLAVFWRPGDWRGREITLLRNQWRSDGFAAVAAYRPSDVTLERDGAPTRVVPGIASTTELFSVLGVQPALGRAFNAGEDVPGSASSVVLSDRVWREFGGDRALVGKSILLNGVKRTVIGVMPSGFWFPDPSIGVWLADELPPDGQVGSYTLVGRVAPGRRVEQ